VGTKDYKGEASADKASFSFFTAILKYYFAKEHCGEAGWDKLSFRCWLSEHLLQLKGGIKISEVKTNNPTGDPIPGKEKGLK
jgi:hypothetical protein